MDGVMTAFLSFKVLALKSEFRAPGKILINKLSSVSHCSATMVVASSSRARILGECSTVNSPPALFFLKWRLACAHLFHSLRQE